MSDFLLDCPFWIYCPPLSPVKHMPLYTLRVCHRPIPGTLHLLSWGAVAGRQPYFIVLDLLVSLPSRLVTGRGWDAVMQLTPLLPHPHLRLAALGAPDVLVVTVVSSPTIRILLLAAPPPLSSPCVPCPRCLYLIYCLRRCWTPLHGSHLLLRDDPPLLPGSAYHGNVKFRRPTVQLPCSV